MVRSAFLFLGTVLLFCVPCIHARSTPAPPQDTLAGMIWQADETGMGRFLGVAGERAFVGGYNAPGLEVWTYPLQIVRHYHVSFRLEGEAKEIDGQSVLQSFENTPVSETRIYAAPNFIVRERIVVPVEAPGATISYSVEASKPVLITVHFTPSLDLMWPAAVGGQDIHWDAANSAYVLDEQTHRFHGAIASRQVVAHDEIQNNARNTEFDRSLAFTVRADPGSGSDATVSMAGSSMPGEDALALAGSLAAHPRELEEKARARYAGLRLLEIETPDESVNRALRWAQISLEQAWVCNPQLGCGLVAGYGPSRGARRPQYDWFFAGDGLVAVNALLREGAFGRAQEELAFIMRYQEKRTGMIWHELSQSAGFLDWSQYPFMFVHVDISFDFLNTVLDYAQTTGDLALVNEHWSAIQAAYEYCRSTVGPDGLPRIPAGKQGGDEQDPLSDELILSVNWVKAAGSFATLAQITHHDQLAEEAKQASERARRSIQPRYYDAARHLWASGHLLSGAPVEGLTTSSVGLLHLGLLNQQETEKVLDGLASPAVLTSWGIRSTPNNAPGYDPESYGKGSVWALGTASAAMAFWEAHRPATAYTIWHALVPWSGLDAPGHMHEVLAGNAFLPERESVPEQTWSSAAFLTSTISGLLGIEVQGREHRLRFAPHLPKEWDSIVVHRIRVGESEIAVDLKRSPESLELSIQNAGPTLTLSFAPELSVGTQMRSASLNGKAISTAQRDEKDAFSFTCDENRITHLNLAFRPGR